MNANTNANANFPNGDKLDQVLRGWADQHQADSMTLDQLHGSILRAVDSGDSAHIPDSTLAEPPRRWRPISKLWFYGMVTALMLFAFLLLPLVWRQQPEPIVSVTPPSDVAALATITPRQLARQEKLFGELERLFGGRLQWVAETDGNVEMGIEPNDAGVAGRAAAKPLVMRFTVARRHRPGQAWAVAWTADVVARSEQLVRFQTSSAAADSPNLLVWTYALPDGKIVCDAELSLQNGADLRVSASELQSPGEVTEVASVEEGGVEYRVFQAVQVLGDEVI